MTIFLLVITILVYFFKRYCWISKEQHGLLACQAPGSNYSEQMTEINGQHNVNIVPDFTPDHVPGDSFDFRGDKVVSTEKFAEVVTSTLHVDDDIVECIDTNSSENAPDIPLHKKSCNLGIMKQSEEKVCFSYLIISQNLSRSVTSTPTVI